MNLLLRKDFSKKIAILAYPVVLGMVSRTIMNLVDAAMVGRLGAAPLAAVGMGGHLTMLTVYSFGTFNIGVQALTSRRFGEGRKDLCGHIFSSNLILIFIIGTIGSIGGYFIVPKIFTFLSADPEVTVLGQRYVAIRLLEFLSFSLIGLCRGFFDGIGNTRVYMRAMIIMNGLNIVLNYLLIFGKFGFPELGVTGAALGSMISTILGSIVMLAHSLTKKMKMEYSLFRSFKPDIELLKSLIKLNLPELIRVFLGYGSFLVFLKILGTISTTVLAAGNVCIAIMSLSYMPGYGIGTAAATFVGQSLGRKEPDLAEKYGWEAVKLGEILMCSVGIMFFFLPGPIMRIFTSDPEIVKYGIVNLRVIAFVQAFDAVAMILACCLQGSGMTRFVMTAEIIIAWGVYLPVSYVFGIIFGWGNFGVWLGLAVYIMLYGITMGLKFHQGKWKTVKI